MYSHTGEKLHYISTTPYLCLPIRNFRLYDPGYTTLYYKQSIRTSLVRLQMEHQALVELIICLVRLKRRRRRIWGLIPWAWVSSFSETWSAPRSSWGRWRCKIVCSRNRHAWQVWRVTLIPWWGKTWRTAGSHQCGSRRMRSLHSQLH